LRKFFLALNQAMPNNFKKYYFFVLWSPNSDITPESLYYETDKKKVLIFISDESGKIPYNLSPYYFAIFKMYLQLDKFSVHNIFNFPLCCVKDVPELSNVPFENRKYSVFFSGNLNRDRMPLYLTLLLGHFPNFLLRCFRFLISIKILKNILLVVKSKFDNKFSNSYIYFTNGFAKGIPPDEYGKIIANSKIVLCPRGFNSPECFRHYEAMRAGCVIISEKLPKTYFYKESPIIQIDNWNEGLKITFDLINNEKKLKEIGKETYNWWKKRCSEKATAHYMNKILEKMK
jgi:hypothetical protein